MTVPVMKRASARANAVHLSRALRREQGSPHPDPLPVGEGTRKATRGLVANAVLTSRAWHKERRASYRRPCSSERPYSSGSGYSYPSRFPILASLASWRFGSRLGSLLVALLVLTAGCTVRQPDRSAFEAHKPRSILVVPMLNETTTLDAPAVVASIVSRPLAERGYYVFPVYLTEALLRDLGLSEAGHVHALPPERFRELFGADAVLFVTITDWGNKYLVIDSATVVQLNFVLRDTRTGTLLWEATETVSQSSGGAAGGDPIAMLIAAAVGYLFSQAFEVDYRPLATSAAIQAIMDPVTGLPPGPYSPEYGRGEGGRE